MASGDPYPNSVIIWTRCAPVRDDVNNNSTVSAYVPLYNPVPIYNESDVAPPSTAPVCVSYKVALDNAFAKVIDSGMAYTSSDVDYTLKVSQCSAWLPATLELTALDRSAESQSVHSVLLSI